MSVHYITSNLETVNAREFLNLAKEKNDFDRVDFFVLKRPDLNLLEDNVDLVAPQKFPIGKDYWIGGIILVNTHELSLTHGTRYDDDSETFIVKNTNMKDKVMSFLVQTKNDPSQGIGVHIDADELGVWLSIKTDKPDWLHCPV